VLGAEKSGGSPSLAADSAHPLGELVFFSFLTNPCKIWFYEYDNC